MSIIFGFSWDKGDDIVVFFQLIRELPEVNTKGCGPFTWLACVDHRVCVKIEHPCLYRFKDRVKFESCMSSDHHDCLVGCGEKNLGLTCSKLLHIHHSQTGYFWLGLIGRWGVESIVQDLSPTLLASCSHVDQISLLRKSGKKIRYFLPKYIFHLIAILLKTLLLTEWIPHQLGKGP